MTFFFSNEVFHHPNYYFPSSWSLICSRQFQIVSGLALLVAKTHLCRRGKDLSSIIVRTVPSIWAWSHSLLSNNPSRFLPLSTCECVQFFALSSATQLPWYHHQATNQSSIPCPRKVSALHHCSVLFPRIILKQMYRTVGAHTCSHMVELYQTLNCKIKKGLP